LLNSFALNYQFATQAIEEAVMQHIRFRLENGMKLTLAFSVL